MKENKVVFLSEVLLQNRKQIVQYIRISKRNMENYLKGCCYRVLKQHPSGAP